jgi:hypothetical protein
MCAVHMTLSGWSSDETVDPSRQGRVSNCEIQVNSFVGQLLHREEIMALYLDNVVWVGASGVRYEFQIDPIGIDYLARPGIYIFCKPAHRGYWRALYVGETRSFYRRLTLDLSAHHKFADVTAAGATHLGTLHIPGTLAKRLRIETDLRHGLKPRFNDQ